MYIIIIIIKLLFCNYVWWSEFFFFFCTILNAYSHANICTSNAVMLVQEVYFYIFTNIVKHEPVFAILQYSIFYNSSPFFGLESLWNNSSLCH